MKFKLLFALSIQRTLYNILIHHAGVENYSYSLLLLIIDTVHFFVCCIMVYLNPNPNIHPHTKWKIMILPAILTFIQQNTTFYGMLLLDPSLHQLIYQINIIFSALITPIKLTSKQNISIITLFIGICIVLLNRSDIVVLPQHSHLEGIIFTIIAAGAAAMSAQAFEDILKAEYKTTWVRQLQLSGLGLSGAIVSCMVEHEKIKKTNRLSNVILLLVFIKCIGDIIIPFVLKYADNVTKGFSDTLAMIMAIPLSQILYHWHPHGGFYIGTIIILLSTYIFNDSKRKVNKVLFV